MKRSREKRHTKPPGLVVWVFMRYSEVNWGSMYSGGSGGDGSGGGSGCEVGAKVR